MPEKCIHYPTRDQLAPPITLLAIQSRLHLGCKFGRGERIHILVDTLQSKSNSLTSSSRFPYVVFVETRLLVYLPVHLEPIS